MQFLRFGPCERIKARQPTPWRSAASSVLLAMTLVPMGVSAAQASTGGWLEPVAELILRFAVRVFGDALMQGGTERMAIFSALLLLVIGACALFAGWRRRRRGGDAKAAKKSMLVGAALLACGAALIAAT